MSIVHIPIEERIRRIRDTFIMLAWTAARQFSHELQNFGLTLPQFVALVSLAAHQCPCTMSDLTKVTLQDPPTMTGIVDRLVKLRLVQRNRSETDRRVVLVEATPSGLKLLRRIRVEALDGVMSDYRNLAEDEVADLDHLLEYFEQSLEFVLRVHLRRHYLADADLDAEIEKIRQFLREPLAGQV